MKAVKWSIVIVGGLLALFVIITFFLPREYHVERSVEISAPRAIIYTQVSDLKLWQEWNPWNEMDPEMALTFSEPAFGVGAWYEWRSEIAGDGRMSIVKATPREKISFELIFEGYESDPSFSSFILEGSGMTDPVQVTWTFEGSVGDKFFGRWMTLMIDKFVGSSYEKGLQSLKDRCEAMEVSSMDLSGIKSPEG